MKKIIQNGQTYRLPGTLNRFQERLYLHLIDWKRKHLTEAAGTFRNQVYDAMLPASLAKQWVLLYPGIREMLAEHRRRFQFRIHKFFNHMASSQVANINLFLPLLQHAQASAILARLKPDLARLATEQLDHGYRIEFWDEPFGVLGDKDKFSGTDADLAIAYYNHSGELCLWLIEHKLSEPEFTICGGYKSKNRKGNPRYDCGKPFDELVANPSACYYHAAKGFNYWKLTAAHREFFPNHAAHPGCPFRGGMNQLWRNQLLALAIEQDERQPYRQVTFSVVRHPENRALDKTLAEYQQLIARHPKFTSFTSADVLAAAAGIDDELQRWISWYRGLYNLPEESR